MPTFANLPAADVRVEAPDGSIVPVNMIRLLVHAQNAEMKVKFDHFLPGVNKLNPTVKGMRDEYPGLITAKTWAEAAEQLRGMHTFLTEEIRKASA